MSGLRALFDGAMAILALGAAYWIRYSINPGRLPITGGEPPDPDRYFPASVVLGLAVVSVFAVSGVYRPRRGFQFIDELLSLIGAMAITALVVLALMSLYRDFSYSRLVFVYWVLTATLFVAVARYALRRFEAGLRSRGIGSEMALVVGHGSAAELVIQRMRMFPDYGYRLAGVVADGLKKGTWFDGAEVLGATRELPRVVREMRVDVVFVALPDVNQDRILQIVDSCRELETDFRIVPSMLELMTTQVTADQLDGIPLLQFRHGLDIDGPKATSKRVVDAVVAAAALILLSPLLLLTALAVRLTSSGPVLLHQERVGMGDSRFRMHKFRSMRQDAEDDSGPVWASPSDPRRTPVGRLIRRLSLDELPQLWNILVGEMSLVGPRPERPVFVEQFGSKMPRYKDRTLVRPGLSGWAQVNDLRGRTPVEERLIYDLYYIENWSLAFDLKILLIQLVRVFTNKNAI